jgi:molybdate transport system substrate-binding protein
MGPWYGRVLLGLLVLALAACGSPAAPAQLGGSAALAGSGQTRELNVFAAASLTEAFGAIGAAFESAHPGLKVVFNFAGSQQLLQQINQGAPADVFASANNKLMVEAILSGHVLDGTERVFARNRLVVIVPEDNPAGITSLADLARPDVKIDLADKSAPAGQYALEVLERAGADPALGLDFKARVLSNVVSYEQNVRTVLSKVVLGEADAGIVYSSDVVGEASLKVQQIAIPAALNTIAAYPIAPLGSAAHPAEAGQFIEFVLGRQGQSILASYGFIPVSDESK